MKKIFYSLICTGMFFSSCQKQALNRLEDGSSVISPAGSQTIKSASGTTYFGNNVILGKGHIRTYVTEDNAGKPIDVGIEFSEAAINTVDMPMKHSGMHCNTYNLRFHPNATKMLPYDHVSLDWAQMGHGPEGVYDVPHFDIHFYMISSDAQMNISADIPYPAGPDAFAYKSPTAVPDTYFPGPFVEMMGTHWIKKEEFIPLIMGEKTFKHTFIYGTLENKLIFFEPMVTLEMMRSRQNIVTAIDQPQDYPIANKYYAGEYAITHNSKTRAHRVSLQNMFLK